MDRRHFLRRATTVATAAGVGGLINETTHSFEQRVKDSSQALKEELQKELAELKAEFQAMDKRTKLLMRALLALAGIDLLLLI